MDYVVNLEQFYGPLDLLLYLVEKSEMNIYDIPIAVITDQYLEYITDSGRIDLDQIGDFLVMASYLLSLKSRMLLPGRAEQADEGEEEEIVDPRAELANRLIAYKQVKQAAELLAQRLNEDYPRAFFRRGTAEEMAGAGEMAASPQTLLRAYLRLLEDDTDIEGYRIPREDVNVAWKMEEIMERLQAVGESDFTTLCGAYRRRREFLAGFLAILELIRLNRIEAMQDTRFGEIKLRVREMP